MVYFSLQYSIETSSVTLSEILCFTAAEVDTREKRLTVIDRTVIALKRCKCKCAVRQFLLTNRLDRRLVALFFFYA
jgi:hypothetical protein